MKEQTTLPCCILLTHIVTEGLLAESVLRQLFFTLEVKVFARRIDEKAAILCANTAVARAGAGNRLSCYGEFDSSTVTGALVDPDVPIGRHGAW